MIPIGVEGVPYLPMAVFVFLLVVAYVACIIWWVFIRAFNLAKSIKTMTNRSKIQVVVTGKSLVLMVIFSYLAISESSAWGVAAALVTLGFFINPRWSKSTGWRFKHDQ